MSVDRFRLIVVIDGVAEDAGSDSISTSLELADIPTLHMLARNSSCGEFLPQDPYTGEIKTDLIIANLLGIRPQPWPGRPYLELLYQGISADKISCCAFIKQSSNRLSRPHKDDLLLLENSLYWVAPLLGFGVKDRPYSRNRSSFIVWTETRSEKARESGIDFVSRLHEIFIELEKRGIEASAQELWCRGTPVFRQFAYQPSFVAMTEGSLPGMCEKSGISLIRSLKRRTFDFSIQDSFVRRLDAAVNGGEFRSGVLYFKDTDWASHYGDQALKIRSIEYLDRLLSRIGLQDSERWNESLLILSDHRSNLNTVQPSSSPSIFAFVSQKSSGAEGFTERNIHETTVRPPLAIMDLHRLLFGQVQNH